MLLFIKISDPRGSSAPCSVAICMRSTFNQSFFPTKPHSQSQLNCMFNINGLGDRCRFGILSGSHGQYDSHAHMYANSAIRRQNRKEIYELMQPSV